MFQKFFFGASEFWKLTLLTLRTYGAKA